MLPPPTNPPVTLPSVVPAGKGEEEEEKEVGGAFGGGACHVAGVRYLEKANDFACNCPVCVCVDEEDEEEEEEEVPIEPDPPFEEEFTFGVVVSRFVTAAAAERVWVDGTTTRNSPVGRTDTLPRGSDDDDDVPISFASLPPEISEIIP